MNIFNRILLFLCILACSYPVIGNTINDRFIVVIDPGHGGNDPGAIGTRGKEKNINLNVARKLGRLIEDNCNDTKVVYTRKSDIFVPLHRRAEIANNAKANLFISIHTNAVAKKNSYVKGTETYTLGLHRTEENLEVAKKENSVILIEDDYKQRYAGFNPNSSESYIIFEFMQDKNMSQSVNFATLIQQNFKSYNRIDKGVHQAGFLVLRETSMPSVLIELGYISNPSEETYLLSDKGTTDLANAIYRAFINYKGNSSKIKPTTVTSNTRQEITTPKEKETKETSKIKFKIQILASDRVLPQNSKQFKGLKPVSWYKENGLIKYTYAEDEDYNKILKIKRKIVDPKFKDAFIIAFKNDTKININKAIKEFKNNNK
ncbi:N-acetylmuramoyl-L-alanine amidase [Bacteroides sp. ET336]|uniref:N-acetylmuramoyl-L-alanine amidase family protein n=1 Tax=Bacteroides sp. ET336 TaxID=2972459 RepID=UPI0021ACCA9F|nr:N-acetylmuramoyl-L-alanine amidase [Bacteroides sp. ET336]MCR8893511.1 N-acetylmuramoyl-L-alanine amidase [Bacteroides sp. ET336]MDN0058008.1 N-acetylmuramoyl-L-alanine amidase [Bacteroides caecigallinarum]